MTTSSEAFDQEDFTEDDKSAVADMFDAEREKMSRSQAMDTATRLAEAKVFSYESPLDFLNTVDVCTHYLLTGKITQLT